MSTTHTEVQEPWWSQYKWYLAAALALLVVLIIVVIVFATRGHHKRHHHHKPTPTPTTTLQPSPTPTPTLAPSPTPTPTNVGGVYLGHVSRPQGRARQIQANATSGQAGYRVYLNPNRAVNATLPSYGFSSGFTVTNAPSNPSVTPTPIANSQGQNTITYTVTYLGHNYNVVMTQLAKQGNGGIWLITDIASTS